MPKKSCPQGLNDFRPIFLISSMYKVLAKVLAERIKSVMESVVSQAQFAFMKNRQITDCILIATEVIHSLKNSKNGGLILKVDFEKAYDTIEWTFLDRILEEMNFRSKWRKWIHFCLSFAIAAVLVNGSPTEFFPMKRGLRQGDPLSPFLFNIVSKGLNVLLTKAKEVGLFSPVDVGRSLMTLLFSVRLSMLYRVGIDERLACVWGDDLGCSIGAIPFHYLGFLIGVNPIFKSVWDPVIENFRDLLSKWKTKFISRAGRVVLLKSVLNSLPLYFMSLFQVHVGVMEEIEKIRRSFFWGKALGERNLCIMDWGTITRRKPNGGLGVGNLRVRNEGLLCKWVWRYGNKKEALWRKLIDAKYGRTEHNLSPSIISKALVSPVWKKITDFLHSMSPSRVVAKKGLVHCVGKGDCTRFWDDHWVEGHILKTSFLRICALVANKSGPVCDFGLWQNGQWKWNVNLRRNIFD
nr:transposon TX1 uncharacterized [Tanacetum cinerariifolium]